MIEENYKNYYCKAANKEVEGSALIIILVTSGLEIATNTVTFATKFVPFVTKISREVTNLQLIFTPALSKQKDYQLPICCYFNKVKKEITKLLFLAVNFFQSEDTLIVA